MHILVNNAGQAVTGPVQETTLDELGAAAARQPDGHVPLHPAGAAGDARGAAGRIVNIASTAGLKGYARVGAYCAAKHGVVGLTRALAAETARTASR